MTPDNPPAYQAPDNPPEYDPPPPYPGDTEEKMMKVEVAEMLERSDEEDEHLTATQPMPNYTGKNIP